MKQSMYIGIVTPLYWDADSGPTAFSLYRYDDEEILLKGARFKNRLIELIGNEVRIEGTIKEDHLGEKFLHIEKIYALNKANDYLLIPEDSFSSTY